MYDVADMRKAIQHPILILREFNRLYHTRLGTRRFNPNGIDIFDEDWDHLIILDACRYDTFKEVVNIPGQLEKRTSRGSNSPEFIRGNFARKQLHDTVYVTTNSWFPKLETKIGAEVHDVIDITTDGRDPTPVTEAALKAIEMYPDKRLIVHYIHPHAPFVGPTANEYLSKYENPEFYGKVQRRELCISDDILRQAYRETLEVVLPEVKTLLNRLKGRTVVTADHGELLGDRCWPVPIKDYGHPSRLYVEQLVTVPWFIYQNDEQKRIISEEPTERTQADETELDKRLRQLGYKV